jgi:hypothetical protein
MYYIICVAVGLALGLAMMIWALTERSKRHTAEENLIKKEVEVGDAKRIAENNVVAVKAVKEELARSEATCTVLRTKIDSMNAVMVKCKDIATIKEWLDKETQAEVL